MTLNNPFATSFGTVTDKDFFIIEVLNKEGLRGYGESVAFSSPWYTEETIETNIHMIVDFLIPLLHKHQLTHPDDITSLFSTIRGNNMAKSSIESALWDLYTKEKDLPLYKIIGGEKRHIDVGISLGIEKNTNVLLQRIEDYLSQGYRRVKLKVKRDHDISVLEDVRKHFPTIPLMVDANSAYTLDDLEHLKQFDEFNLMMREQPLAHDDIIDHAELQANITTPICLDESIHSLADVRQAIRLGSCEIINIKPGRVGGISEAKRIHDYCLDKRIHVWCGGMLEAGVGRAHNIALATLAGFTLPGDIAGSSHYWENDIIYPEVVVKDGQIEVSDEPGIGHQINEEQMEKFTVLKREFYF